MKVILTEEEAKEIEASGGIEVKSQNNKVFVYFDETETIDEGKYSHKEVIFCEESKKKTGPYYSLGVSISGSWFTYYERDYDLECPEVHQVIVKKKVWEVKK